MRWLPIRWRLTLFHAITMGAIMTLLVLAMFGTIGFLQDDRLRNAISDCAWVAESALRNTGTLDPAYLASLDCDGVTLAALDAEGRVLDQFGYAGEVGEVYPGDVWRTAIETQQPTQDRRARIAVASGVRFAYAIPVSITDPPARAIVSSTSYDALRSDMIYLIPVIIAGVAIIALIVITIASYFLVRSSLAPVSAITSAARQITESDLSRRLPVGNARDELGRLSATINDLLARLETAFDQRERSLAEQRRFVGDASHELRTPLTSILGYTRMLRQWGLNDPATARESVDALEQEAERMHRLVESLLRLARGDEAPALSQGEHDLRAIVEEAAAAARAFAARPPEIRVELPETPVRVTGDREMMIQVVEVLLDNALKHAGARPIDLSLSTESGDAEIRVRDRGPGIAPEHLPHLFERFYRVETARSTRGSGLGLAIAKQIVEQHGGTIAVESTPGEGSTFAITLPVLDASHQTRVAVDSATSL